MITKRFDPSSFELVLGYHLKKQEEKNGALILSNMQGNTQENLINEFRQVYAKRRGDENPLFHSSFSFSPTDTVNNAMLKRMTLTILDRIGLRNNQFLAFRHFDTDHPHVHIVANLVTLDGRMSDIKNMDAKCVIVSRQLEREFELERINLWKSKWLAVYMTRGDDRSPAFVSSKTISKDVASALHGEPSLYEFLCRTEVLGLDTRLNISFSRGITNMTFSHQASKCFMQANQHDRLLPAIMRSVKVTESDLQICREKSVNENTGMHHRIIKGDVFQRFYRKTPDFQREIAQLKSIEDSIIMAPPKPKKKSRGISF